MTRTNRCRAGLALLCCLWAGAAGAEIVAEQVRSWREVNEQAIVDDFAALLRLPNVARNRADIEANARHIIGLLESAGLAAQRLTAGQGNPAVYAERLVDADAPTIVMYAHFDGQPVETDDWASDPWHPVLRDAPVETGGREVPMNVPFDPEWRLFARSAGDDKAPIIALRAALMALDALSVPLHVNLKVFLDGEEEAGSPGLQAMLTEHRELLRADLWLFCDGPMHQSRRPQLVYGVRGVTGFQLTVHGANRPLHSGHYGNWAPNPIMMLTELIRSMRNPEGRVLIEGFHDEVRDLTAAEQAMVEAAPRTDEALLSEFGLARAETGDRIEYAVLRPALNLRGIRSGGVGADSRNAIQPSATASVGLRLVPNQTPVHLRQVVEAHIRAQGYRLIHGEPTPEDRASGQPLAQVQWSSRGGYPAYRASAAHPLVGRVGALLDAFSGGELIHAPTMGGSLPLHVIDRVLDVPVLILPVANHDNNQHGANENLRLQNLWDAIETYAVLLAGL